MSILLIYPPFGGAGIPPIGIAALAGYLRSRYFEVDTLDANNEFFHWAFTPEKEQAAWDFAARRLEQLNGRDQLEFPEEVEYACLVQALAAAATVSGCMRHPDCNAKSMGPAERFRLMQAAAQLVSAPHFPEMLDVAWPGITYRSPWDLYTTPEIIASANHPGLLAGFFEQQLEPLLLGKSYAVIGISVIFPQQLLPAFLCAKVIKELSPETHVTIGGSSISAHFGEIGNAEIFSVVDSLVMGDGERPLELLLQECIKSAPNLRRVPGLVYRSEGAVLRNPPAESIDLGLLPPPDYGSFQLDRYPLPRHQLWIPYRLTRGCTWGKCTFCRLDIIGTCQQPPADHALGNIKEVIRQTGVSTINFTDDEGLPELLGPLSEKILEDGIDFKWTVSHRFEASLTPELCALYRRAGCRFLFMGLESLNDRMLQLMRKGISVQLVDTVLANLKAVGIGVHAFMIIGFPGETEAEARVGFDHLNRLRREGLILSYNYSAFQILPGSPVAENPAQYGISMMHEPAPDRDLPHPCHTFQAGGMSRETVFKLEQEFNGFLAPPADLSEPEGSTLPRHRLPAARIDQLVHQMNSNKLPFLRWLHPN